MTAQRLKLLAIVVGGLIVLWGAVEILQGGSNGGRVDFVLAAATVDGTDSVLIARPSGSIRLARVGDNQWSVNGHRAALAAVTEFFDALGQGSGAELVARNPSSHARLQVDSASGRHLRVFQDGSVTIDLVVGKRGRSVDEVYVRRPSEDDAYALRGRLSTYVDRRLDDWRDKVIVAISPDSVHEVEVRRGTAKYHLARSDSTWTVDGGRGADTTAVRRLLDQFRALNATGFPSPVQLDSVDFSESERQVALTDAQDRVLTDLMFDSTATGFWVQRRGDSVVYRLDRFRVDQLTPTDSTIRGT